MREIATSPKLLTEARNALPTLEANAKAPAGEGGVARVLGPRLAIFPVNLPAEAMDAWWADYYETLSDLPATALEAGMRAHIRSGAPFMPKPGELRQLALTTQNPAVRALDRAKAAIDYKPPREYDPVQIPEITPRIMRQEPSAREKAWAREAAAAFGAQVEAKKKPQIEGFRFEAKVDEHGVTPEMQALLAERMEAE